MAHYLDSSALAKLIIAEQESTALQQWLTESPRNPVTCDLARTELMRAVRRKAPELASHVRQVLDRVIVIQITPTLFEQAGRLEPTQLRSLDAVHLASALNLGDDLDGFVSYDDRLNAAAEQAGAAVVTPGR